VVVRLIQVTGIFIASSADQRRRDLCPNENSLGLANTRNPDGRLNFAMASSVVAAAFALEAHVFVAFLPLP
jgi:hypothetical protein